MQYFKNTTPENILDILGGALIAEEWKDIVGYEGHYQVSNYGRVKSIARILSHPHSKIRTWKEKILKQSIRSKTSLYLTIDLVNSKKERKTALVHILVASAFCDNSEHKSQVNHINGNKTDNVFCNLEWNTPSENALHAIRTRLRPERTTAAMKLAHVIMIRKMYLNEIFGVKEMAKNFSVSKRVIDRIIKRETWKSAV